MLSRAAQKFLLCFILENMWAPGVCASWDGQCCVSPALGSEEGWCWSSETSAVSVPRLSCLRVAVPLGLLLFVLGLKN